MFARYMKVPRTGLKLLVAMLAIAVISGCSSTSLTRVKTWEGESSGEVAVLRAPSTIKVREVNGNKVGNFLMEDLAIDYELQPGTNTIVFTHKTIWAKSGVVRDGESAVHVVETAPQQMEVDARPGETYRFDVPKVDSRREAERLASNFSVPLVTEGGNTVARSEAFKGYAERSVASGEGSGSGGDQAGATDAPSSSGMPVVRGQGGSDSRVETLEAMKMLWERASGDEKREFLRWAFD